MSRESLTNATTAREMEPEPEITSFMPPSIINNRWKVSETDYATRITIPDLKGFFDGLPFLSGAPKGRSLVIEPGSRSVIIDDGMVLGELLAGEYTFESFTERLKFWRNKQTTAFLTRREELPVETHLANLPCLEGICFDLNVRWTIQMGNVLLFMENLMGAQEHITVSKLEELLAPSWNQAIRDSIGQMSYDTLVRGDYLGELSNAIRSRIEVKFARYGLAFVDLQSATATPRDGGASQRQGELWLKARETQIQKAASEADNDQLRANAEDMRNKADLRVALRSIVNDDSLNKIKSREEFEAAILEIDKGRLLRKEEREELVAAYDDRKQDREQLRTHLLAILDIQREQELDQMRLAMDHAFRMKSLSQEIEQSKLSQTLESNQWRSELEREREEAEQGRQQRHLDVRARWDRIREARRQGREDSFEGLVHEQRSEAIRSELELARAERQRQITLVQAELENRLANEKLEIQKRQELWELEARDKKSTSQLDRLQRIQEMNALFAEKQQRLQMEMENLKADSASKREQDRLRAMSTVSTEVLIAASGEANAALLADLKKHEATQEAIKVQASSAPAAELNAERLKMYEQMNATERAKAEAIAEAYKMAMQAQQASVHQMIGGLTQVASPSPQSHSGYSFGQHPGAHYPSMPPMTSAPPPMAPAEVWHISINGQPSPPLSWSQFQQSIQSGQVTQGTMVWKTGMAAWVRAEQVPELSTVWGTTRPPMPGPPGPPPL